VDLLIGRGGMGVVYRATDLSLERPVALKLIAPELDEEEHCRSRFLREPRLGASLDHPNVIPIYEAGEHDRQLYLAMRFVEGSDLKRVLEREGKLAPGRALAVPAPGGRRARRRAPPRAGPSRRQAGEAHSPTRDRQDPAEPEPAGPL
jgi:Protein kinase domain